MIMHALAVGRDELATDLVELYHAKLDWNWIDESRSATALNRSFFRGHGAPQPHIQIARERLFQLLGNFDYYWIITFFQILNSLY